MVQPTRSPISFPMNTVTVLALFGAATNLTLIVAALAIQHFALMAMGGINLAICLLAAYHARKYIVLHIHLTPTYSYGPFSSVTLDSYTVTSERSPTPSVTQLSSSMASPLLQQAAQTGPANNPAAAAVIANP